MGPFWDHFGTVLGPFWDRFGTILGPFCNHFGTILGALWDHLASGIQLDEAPAKVNPLTVDSEKSWDMDVLKDEMTLKRIYGSYTILGL